MASGKESACQCRRHKRHRFDPLIGKIPWRRKWQPTPVFLPGESHGQRSLVGYSPWGRKGSDMTETTWHTHTLTEHNLQKGWFSLSWVIKTSSVTDDTDAAGSQSLFWKKEKTMVRSDAKLKSSSSTHFSKRCKPPAPPWKGPHFGSINCANLQCKFICVGYRNWLELAVQECVVAVGLELEVSTQDLRAQVGASLVKGDLGGIGSRERHTAGGDGEESLRRKREGCRGDQKTFPTFPSLPRKCPFHTWWWVFWN